jgi:hypothetical protein
MKQAKAKTPAHSSRPARSLTQFVRDQRKNGCKVCALGAEVIQQIKTASRNKIPQQIVLDWLREEHGADVTAADLRAHSNQRHNEE